MKPEQNKILVPGVFRPWLGSRSYQVGRAATTEDYQHGDERRMDSTVIADILEVMDRSVSDRSCGCL
jgi:hypothetical protein